MKNNYARIVIALIILFGLLAFCETEALARRRGLIPFIINTGDVIYPVGPVPTELIELSEDPEISNWKLGYKCSHFGILFADIACWDKELVIFKHRNYTEIPAEIREQLKKDYPFSKAERSAWNKYGVILFILVIVFGIVAKVRESSTTEKENDQDGYTDDDEFADSDFETDETKCPKCDHERKILQEKNNNLYKL